MILKLTGTQRLNLVSILDTMEVQGRREVHAVCKLQDKIDLSDEERKIIDYRKEKLPDGREYAMWAANGHIPERDFELSSDDSSRITKAVDNYRVILARDKHWWLPLIAQLPEEGENVSGSQPDIR